MLEGVSQSDLFNKVNEVCGAVNSVSTSDELLDVSLSKIMDLFGACRGSIYILKEDEDVLVLKVSKGMKRKDENQLTKSFGKGFVGKVAEMKKPIFVEDIASDKRFKNYKPRSSYSTNSFICAPLLVKDELLGVINITDKESGSRFKEEEIQLLDFLSIQIALNYRRLELYKKLEKVVREAQNLKTRLIQSDQKAEHLKKHIFIQDRLASIGKLAGGIAHEFNNPLDGVLRYTNLCLEHLKDDDIVRGYLLEIKYGLNRMAGIVRNLLSCSRTGIVKNEKIDLAKALELSLDSLKTELSCKNISVEKSIAKGLPPIIDLGLERIFVNLLRNAIDAMDDGGKITVSANLEGDLIQIKIVDTGKGIPEQEVEKIFEPFYTTKDLGKGCGLGLTIVYEIVKIYNGSIEVESKPGKNTTFKIILPTVGIE